MSDSMWHEARRQERRIKGMLVDYRRRAERRRDFYERIKADPTQFLQVHGRQCKVHLDPAIAAAADSATAMMPWQGDSDNLIDRFDVRAHLDFIPPIKKEDQEEELTQDERQLNYERYRIIAQNSFLGLSEEKFLKQLHIEEQFGYTDNKEKKKERSGGVAIGFNYEDGSGISQTQASFGSNDADSEHSDSDLDVDLSINVSKMDPSEAHEMNRHGRNYGMSSNDFYSFLIKDLDEAESYRLAKEEEHEKALYAGRKSRRERRAHREKRLANRVISPPSYAARTSPDYTAFKQDKSPSKSPSPDNAGKITYITSFGDEEDAPPAPKPTYADKVKTGTSKGKDSSFERISYSKSNNRKKSSSRDARSRSRQRFSRSKERFRKRSRSSSGSTSSPRKRPHVGRKSRSTSSSSSSPSRIARRRSRSSSSSSTSVSREKKKSSSRSLSKSPSVKKESPPKVIPRYYGRKKSDLSSSELSDSDQNEKDDKEPSITNTPGYGNSGTSFKKSTGSSANTASLSIQERLKRKRQALLNRQFKADKIAEMTKAEKEKQEQQNREDELREMTIKFRKRQRERRHAYDSDSSSSTHSGTVHSRSPNHNKSGSTSPSEKKEDNEQKKRSDKEDESRESHSKRKSPVKNEDKKDDQSVENNRRYSYDRGNMGRGRREWRDIRDRRDERDDRKDERDRRYQRDRRDDRSRWEDNRDRDRRNDRDRRDDRNRWDDKRNFRDRRDWRDRDSSRRDRYEEIGEGESNKSQTIRSLVDY
ncbi:hypothetical protein WA026_006128 [Henosepilachna vigintioctopunctata]|uniref:Suppressor of white apricot N-terminal domain-containing protein n=1 Tax=Henosepilachna vigintioctopunctata TaxID=420089 RepID=A0AAW1TNQ0_9CUCU